MLQVMIVDDEELSVRRLNRLLTESGRVGECHCFLNPEEAFRFAVDHPIDIAFLDISMPKLNGMALSELLKETNDRIGIVFVTGYDHYALRAFEQDALDYLLKPATGPRLIQSLERLEQTAGRAKGRAEHQKLTARLFNGFSLHPRNSDEPLKLRSPKTEELFAFLLLKESVNREKIVDTLWQGLEPDKAWKNLNSTLYYIRKSLAEYGADDVIESDLQTVRIDKSAIRCDLYDFEELLLLDKLAHEFSFERFLLAKILYTGPLLKDKAYDWATDRVIRTERGYTDWLEAAAVQCQSTGRPNVALHYYRQMLSINPMHLNLQGETIRTLVGLGRIAEAVACYEELERLMLRELGQSPAPDITELIVKAQAQS